MYKSGQLSKDSTEKVKKIELELSDGEGIKFKDNGHKKNLQINLNYYLKNEFNNIYRNNEIR